MGTITIVDMEYPKSCFGCDLNYTYHNTSYPNEPEYQEVCCLTKKEPNHDKCPLIQLDARYLKIVRDENGKIDAIAYNSEFIKCCPPD